MELLDGMSRCELSLTRVSYESLQIKIAMFQNDQYTLGTPCKNVIQLW